MQFDWGFIAAHFFDRSLIDGAVMTIFLSVVAQVAGVLLGLLAALMKLSKNPILNGIASFYIWLFRGTPLLVQLIVFATGLYEIGIHLELLAAALLALSLNEGAYMAEIVRAGIESIDPGQMEAAKSLGMTYGTGMRRIVLPQAARVILPPLGNEFNNMLKSSSLASVISIKELLDKAGDLNHLYFKTLETFMIVSCYYLAMTTVVTVVQGWTESRLGDRRGQEAVPTFWGRLRTNVLSTTRFAGRR
ncbi:MAG TPA: amino acid ABC transporter permease [Chloroflexia bacterium]|nr:amino acid ABC transporter permease [Chloroflexia bacterium]